MTINGQTGGHVLCLRATVLGDQRMCMIVDDANKQNKWYIWVAYTICQNRNIKLFSILCLKLEDEDR